MEKKCDCACHQLHPIPCMFCSARHVEPAAADPFDAAQDHDGKTDPQIALQTDEEGFPF